MSERRTVWDRLVAPDGSPQAGKSVVIRAEPAPVLDPLDDSSIVAPLVVTTTSDGLWTADLRPTDQLAPQGAKYCVSVEGHLGDLYCFELPSGVGSIWVGDLVDATPSVSGAVPRKVSDAVVAYDATKTPYAPPRPMRGVHTLAKDSVMHPWPNDRLDLVIEIERPAPAGAAQVVYGDPLATGGVPLDVAPWDVVETSLSLGFDVTYDYNAGPPPWLWPDGSGYGVTVYVGYVVVDPTGAPVRYWRGAGVGLASPWGPDNPTPEIMRWFGRPTDSHEEGHHLRAVAEDEIFDGILRLRPYYIARPDDPSPTVDVGINAWAGDPAVGMARVWRAGTYHVVGGFVVP